MTISDQMISDQAGHAPDHLVSFLASVVPAPRPGPTGEPTEVQWMGQMRLIADRIWSEAWFRGASYGLSIQPARIEISGDGAALDSLRQRLAGNRQQPINLGESGPTR